MTFVIFERYEAAIKLWEFVAPAIPVPPKETLIWWLSKYTNEQFEKAVLKIPNRFRNRGMMSTEDAARMVSAELRDLNLRKTKSEVVPTATRKTEEL